ncbi:hypothetical protein BASA81_003545 [Batrachochytrium salamandrivorans]|nr:hypothetical protein BASA81_003545 [Batrachochytrium salamandrivorans]
MQETSWRLSDLMSRSPGAIEGAIQLLGEDHKLSRKLSKFLDEIQSLHQTCHQELQELGQQQQHVLFPLDDISSSPFFYSNHHQQPPPARQQQPSPLRSYPYQAAMNNNRQSGKMLRFNRKEMDFVRSLKINKTPISEISCRLTRDFPKWTEVEPDRLLAKIRRVRKRKDEDDVHHNPHLSSSLASSSTHPFMTCLKEDDEEYTDEEDGVEDEEDEEEDVSLMGGMMMAMDKRPRLSNECL